MGLDLSKDEQQVCRNEVTDMYVKIQAEINALQQVVISENFKVVDDKTKKAMFDATNQRIGVVVKSSLRKLGSQAGGKRRSKKTAKKSSKKHSKK